MPKIPIGPATIAGYSVSLAGFIAAVLAYANGSRDEQTLGVITAGAIGAIAFVITQAGRYAQAKAEILVKRALHLEPIQLEAIRGETATTMPPAGMVYPTSSTAVLEPADIDDEAEPRDELDDRAEAIPITEDPPPDEGDAGNPALTAPTGGQA